ncbi:MAG TPA: hypothetical protein VKL99_14200, partial [Candidatus Angelobacter sp.]|nr:hypothetical protein [Candidatus Angelobacter sp.]
NQRERVSAASPLAALFSRTGLISFFLGVVVVLFNFSALIEHFLAATSWHGSAFAQPLDYILLLPKQLHSSDLLYTCLFVCFCGFWLYLAMLLLLAVMRRNAFLAAQGSMALITGILILPLMGWSVLLVYWVLWAIFKVLSFVIYIANAIIGFLVFLMHYLWPVLVAGLIIALLVWLWKQFGFKGFAFAAGIAVLLYLVWPFLRNFLLAYVLPVLQWCAHILGVVLGWVMFLVKWLFVLFLLLAVCLLAVSSLACIGFFVLDQFRTAWECGRSRKGVVLGSLSLGVGLSLIFLVSVGSLQPSFRTSGAQGTVVEASMAGAQSAPAPKKKAHKNKKGRKPQTVAPLPSAPVEMGIEATMDLAARHGGFALVGMSLPRFFTWSLPHSMREWASESFHHAHAPTFDAILLVLALLISVLGLARGMFTKEEFELKYKFYNRDLLVLVGVPVFLLIALLAAGDSNQG